jgi:hypothetical protein
MTEFNVKDFIKNFSSIKESDSRPPDLGTKVRHKAGWEGLVVARPTDAGPSIRADAVWVDGKYGVHSNSPEAFREDFTVL